MVISADVVQSRMIVSSILVTLKSHLKKRIIIKILQGLLTIQLTFHTTYFLLDTLCKNDSHSVSFIGRDEKRLEQRFASENVSREEREGMKRLDSHSSTIVVMISTLL